MKTHLEQEVKLQVPRRFDLQLLEQGLDGYTASPLQARTLTTVYYDTDDLRLIRWGCSLRHRKGEGWTLKLPAGDGPGGAVRRFEHVFPEGGSKPPDEALELVTAFVRGKPVVPVLKLRTLRKSVRLHGAAGEELAEVVDDDVRVLLDGHVADRFREVEVELMDGAPESVLTELTQWLQNAGAGSFDETPKAVRALGPAAKAPTELHPVEVKPDSDAATLVRNALMSSVEQLLRHDALLRLHADPEIVHKARVATRRLRSDLRSLMPLLDETWARSLRSRIKWLADELGSVRDADVLLSRLRRDASQLPRADNQAAEAVTDRFAAQSTAARERLKSVLREERYVTLLDELVRSAADPKLGPQAGAPAADVLPALVDEPWRKLCRAYVSKQNAAGTPRKPSRQCAVKTPNGSRGAWRSCRRSSATCTTPSWPTAACARSRVTATTCSSPASWPACKQQQLPRRDPRGATHGRRRLRKTCGSGCNPSPNALRVAHVRHERFWDGDGTVALLIILQDGYKRAADRKT